MTTHSPLVMSAAERFFDEARDRWFDLVLAEDSASGGQELLVELRNPHFERHGTVGHWLESDDAFGLPTDRGNTRAERLILKARAMASGEATLEEIESLNRQLVRELEANDPFLARWGYFLDEMRRRGRANRQ